jgi:hypothetical protein
MSRLRRNSVLLVLLLVLGSCASVDRRIAGDFTFRKMESVTLNSTKVDVLKALGEPAEKEQTPDGGNSFFYNYSDGGQAGVMGFDAEDRLIVKGFHILEGTPESDISYLMSKKYAGLKFEKIQPPMCGLDFLKPPVYVNKASGISIQTFASGRTDFIFWDSATEFEKTIARLKGCKDRKRKN